MNSAFGIDHGDVSKGLKPQHVDALKRVAAKEWRALDADSPKIDYARARLGRHEIGEHPVMRKKGTISARMYGDNEKSAVTYNAGKQTRMRRGKTGIRAMEGPKIEYGRRKGHLRLVKSSS